MSKSIVAAAFLALLAAGTPLFAENRQKIVPVSSGVYDGLQSLYLAAGLAPPFASQPYTVQEAAQALDRIPVGHLSPAARSTYDYIRSKLTHRTLTHGNPRFQLDVAPKVTVAGYLQSNPSAAANSSESAWVKRPSVLDIPLELWLGEDFYADFEVPLLQDPFVAQAPAGYGAPAGFTGNPTNLPLAADQIYAELPYRAFMSLGGEHWNVEFGRDTVAWGNGPFGNLVLSDNTDYYDLLRFTTFWKNFKFTAAYIDLPPYYHPVPNDIASGLTSNGASLLTSSVPNKGPLMTKFLLSHRIEFRIRRRATVALSEAMVLGGIGLPFGYLNPLMLFHNYNIWDVANDIASAEFSVNPYRWLTLFGQFAINQVGGSIEPYKGAENTPTALGYLFGATGSYPLGSGYLVASGQWTLTDPWLYIGGRPGLGPLPWLTLDAERRYLSNFLSADPVVAVPIGWLYGPDSLVWNASIAYEKYGRYKAGVAFRFQQQGSNTITSAHGYGLAAAALKTPSGPNPIKTSVVHLFGNWTVGRLFGVDTTLGSDLSFIDVRNVDHDSGKQSFNVQFVTQVTFQM